MIFRSIKNDKYDILRATREELVIGRYSVFANMYGLFFNSFVRLFMLHGVMSSVFLGIVAAINADSLQEPFFYLAALIFYAVISIIIILIMFRLRSLISIYSSEISSIEMVIRSSSRLKRVGPRTSDLVTSLIIFVSMAVSCYLIAPARDHYAFLEPFSSFLSLFDVPIDLSGLGYVGN
jgi:hypothetical protein